MNKEKITLTRIVIRSQIDAITLFKKQCEDEKQLFFIGSKLDELIEILNKKGE